MREMDWPQIRDPRGIMVRTENLVVARLAPGGATLLSGNLAAAISALNPGAPILGLGAQCGTGAYAARIARDRAVLFSDAPLSAPEGWSDAGYAATAADDLWAAFLLRGLRAPEVIAEATAADLEFTSPSAAVSFAGQTCLILRRGEDFVLHTESSLAWCLAEWLADASTARWA